MLYAHRSARFAPPRLHHGRKDERLDWLLFSYRTPAQPSALRVAVWRELRQSGAVAIGAGLYAFPNRADYIELLGRLTEKLELGGGSAVSFSASALGARDERRIADAIRTAREDEYRQVIKSAAKFIDHVGREDEERDYRFAEVEALEEELAKVRRQLERVVRRDPGGVDLRAEAETTVQSAAERLEEYVKDAYENDAAAH